MAAQSKPVRPKKSYSIRAISMAIQLCTSVVLILLVAFTTYLVYSTSLLGVIGSNRTDVLSQVGNRVRDFKSNAYTISNLYYNDTRFTSYAVQLAAPDAPESLLAEFSHYMDSITAQYKISFNQVNLDYNVVYRAANGRGYCSCPVPEDYDYIDPEIRIWYRDLYRADGAIVDVASFKDKALGTNAFVAARSVQNLRGEIIGYLMITVDERQIYDTYAGVVAEDSSIYITDDKGYIISSSNTKIVGSQYFNMANLNSLFGGEEYAVIQLPKGRSLFSKYQDAGYGFTVFEETPLQDLLAPVRQTRNVVIAITSGIALLGVLLSWWFSGRITRPILRLRDSILQVEGGNLEVQLEHNGYTELNILNDGIRQMLARIRDLLESEKRKEKQKRKMQYHLLQAQINPHFMYNTLFSIKCVVELGENAKASEMLSAFIQLLRNTLTDPDSMTTVRRQMEGLRQYARLQQFRFGAGLDVIIEYDETVAEAQLPALIVQPLVENAILHGGEAITENGVIAISVRPKHGRLVIEVEDNGTGMSAAQIETALNGAWAQDGRPHVGLSNIRERIALLFGPDPGYGLRIESQQGEGTKVIVSLPLLQEGGKADDSGTCGGR